MYLCVGRLCWKHGRTLLTCTTTFRTNTLQRYVVDLDYFKGTIKVVATKLEAAPDPPSKGKSSRKGAGTGAGTRVRGGGSGRRGGGDESKMDETRAAEPALDRNV